MTSHRPVLYCALAALLSVFALAPLTYPGFFEVESGFMPVFTIQHLSNPTPWGQVDGSVRGEGRLPYQILQPALQMTGRGTSAIKWGYALAFVLGALGAFAWTRQRLTLRGGILAAVVYTYLPWHLNTVYVRGAYAEAWLWAIWPWLFWSLDHLAQHRRARTLAAILTGAPILWAAITIQPGLTTLLIPLWLAYGALTTFHRNRLALRLVVTTILTGLILWVVSRAAPAAQISFADHYLDPFELLSASQKAALLIPDLTTERVPTFQLGLVALGLATISLAQMGRSRHQVSPDHMNLSILWVTVLAILIALVLPISAPFWRLTGLDRLLTAPWQVLALTGLPLAYLAGSVCLLDKRLQAPASWAALIALAILSSYPYLAPSFTQLDPGAEPVALLQPVEAEQPQIALLDYQIQSPTEITPTVTLTMTWQTVEPLGGDYTVFVHLLDDSGAKAAQKDTRPCDGECPTISWHPGDLIVDRYKLNIPKEVPAGPYRLAVGLYLLDSGQRAAVIGRDDDMVVLDVP